MKTRWITVILLVMTYLMITGFAPKNTEVAYVNKDTIIYGTETTQGVHFLPFGQEVVALTEDKTAGIGDGENRKSLFGLSEEVMVKIWWQGGIYFIPKEAISSYQDILQDNISSGLNLYLPPILHVENQSKITFVGDSRTVQMYQSLGVERDDYNWIGEVGRGYQWLTNTAVPLIDDGIEDGDVFVIQMGLNDLQAFSDEEVLSAYTEFYNVKCQEWIEKGAKIFCVSMDYVEDNAYGLTNDRIKIVNERLKKQLIPEIIYIDLYQIGEMYPFITVDGIHYNVETYQFIMEYLLQAVSSKEI